MKRPTEALGNKEKKTKTKGLRESEVMRKGKKIKKKSIFHNDKAFGILCRYTSMFLSARTKAESVITLEKRAGGRVTFFDVHLRFV